ncbi:MAG: TolC family protein [Gemmatimonadota bacterium]|nr:TolC family protein [Gemmatimonadota bacterium]
MRLRALGLLCALAAGGPPALAAQQPAPLTLEQALERARTGNPEYRAALNNLELTVPETRQAWGAFLPELSLSAGTNGGFVRQLVGTDDFGNPVANPNAQTRYNSGSRQGLSISMPLFEGGRRFHALGEARAAGEARRWTATAELVRVAAQVERDFFAAQRQQELLAIEEELLEENRRDLDATERLFALAAKSRSDVLGAQLAVRRQEVEVRSASGERAKALLSLEAAVGGAAPVGAVAPAALDLFDPAALDIDALVERAVATSPVVRGAEAGQLASNASAAAARAARWPSVSLSGGLGRGTFGPDADALFDLTPDDQSQGSLELSLRIPLFSRFQTSYQIAQAEVASRNAQETTRQRRLEVERDVRQASIDLDNAYEQVQTTAQAQEVADERLRLVREEYRLAVKSFEDLQAAVREAAEARRAAVSARYDFVLARVALETAVGAPIRPGAPEPD